MSNACVLAAAIGLPSSNSPDAPAPSRRGVLIAGSALVAAMVVPVSLAPAIADPVHALIENYYAGLAAYTDSLDDTYDLDVEDRLAEATYRPWYEKLSAPLPAITTIEGAKAALTLIREENELSANSPAIPHLTDALFAWIGDGA